MEAEDPLDVTNSQTKVLTDFQMKGRILSSDIGGKILPLTRKIQHDLGVKGS